MIFFHPNIQFKVVASSDNRNDTLLSLLKCLPFNIFPLAIKKTCCLPWSLHQLYMDMLYQVCHGTTGSRKLGCRTRHARYAGGKLMAEKPDENFHQDLSDTLAKKPHPGCNRHHQDYEPFFGRESQPKPSFVTVTGWGGRPK